MTYITGFLVPVPKDNRDAYVQSAEQSWPLFEEYGALKQVEGWGEDVPDGEHTSFPMAVKLQDGEVVVFSWLIWPDKQTADEAWKKMQEDERMKNMQMPFDGKRMIWGGFSPVFEAGAA